MLGLILPGLALPGLFLTGLTLPGLKQVLDVRLLFLPHTNASSVSPNPNSLNHCLKTLLAPSPSTIPMAVSELPLKS